MKRLQIFALALAAVFVIAGCEQGYEVLVDGNSDRYQSSQNAIISLRNEAGQAYYTTVEMRREQQDVNLTGRLLGHASVGVDAVLSFGDADMVEQYNATYGTSYEMFPVEDAELSTDEMVFSMGSSKSIGSVRVTLDAKGIRPDVTYMLPVLTRTDTKGVVAGDPMYILVKDYRSIPNNDKGIKLFNCIESDENSILDNLAFRLKNSGKYLIDVLIIFTSGGDVNYSTTTGEINIPSNGGTINHVAHQKEIIEEVHKRGVKVICTVTTRGIAQLELETAKDFARKLADFVYSHNLDGVFFDTEYTTDDSTRPGFTSSSAENMTRFLLEVKRAMPDKLLVTYLYSNLSALRYVTECDGVPLKDFVDYGLNDYGASIAPAALGKERVGIYSDNFVLYYNSLWCDSESYCKKAGEYGAHMFYCFTTGRYLDPSTQYNTARKCISNIARLWYNDEVVCEPLDDIHKDW